VSDEPTFTPEQREAFLNHLRGGMMLGAAAYVLELPRHVIEGYIAEHPEFKLEVRDAEATADEHVHEALYQAAASGNVNACKLWLEMRGRLRSPGKPPPTGGPVDPELAAVMDELG